MSQLDFLPASVLDLPIANVLDDVVQALQSRNVLLQAEPGAGKSTGLPLALLQLASTTQRIVMLEPRRLAARSVAERLANQLGETLGQRIGLRMRSDTRVSNSTVIEVVTEGVLTRLLQSDPLLSDYGVVIFDEYHERSLHADLGLALCLEVQNSLREDLRLLLMSATLNTDELAAHLEAHRHPSLQPLQQIMAAGRQHPVDVKWLGSSTNARGASDRHELPRRIVHAVLQALESNVGDVLVFLPGVAEIENTAKLLQARLTSDQGRSTEQPVVVHRLHSRIDSESQRRATAPANAAARRVILSTSLAETS